MLTDAAAAAPTHTQVWFGPEDRPLWGWVSRPADGRARGGVVLCPPMGEEGRAAHRTFRRLADSLAAAGLVALRFDYDGTGDSAGGQHDPDRVEAWLASVEAARQHLLDLGVTTVSALGMRLGATLAAVQAARGGAFDRLVAWDPCVSGRTFLREGEALYRLGVTELALPDDDLRHTPGFQYDADTAAALRGLDLAKLPTGARLADAVLLLHRDDRPVPPATARALDAATGRLETQVAHGQAALLAPPDQSLVPEDTLALVLRWLRDAAADRTPTPVKAPDAERPVELGGPAGTPRVRERLVRFGPQRVVGVVDEPLDGAGESTPWVVLVNVASEHHIGPGRRWVEWARTWAGTGYRVVRIDLPGVGESPTPPGRPDDLIFAPEWIDAIRNVVAELGGQHTPVGVVGLCSGSYSAFEAALWERVDGVFAINPRLTIYAAAKGTPAWTPRRRAAIVPNKPFADLARRRRILAGGLWRIYREVAVWHAPLLVLWRVLRRGTVVEVVACPDDGQHFTEVYALRPLLWWMRRRSSFRFAVDGVVDHSLHSKPAQDLGFAMATDFLDRRFPLRDAA